MSDILSKKAVTAPCPSCNYQVSLGEAPVEGQKVMCSNCGDNLEVISVQPLELDWEFESIDENTELDDWDDEEWADDEDEELVDDDDDDFVDDYEDW
jgi:lysine biosynthesis protein LysW